MKKDVEMEDLATQSTERSVILNPEEKTEERQRWTLYEQIPNDVIYMMLSYLRP